MAFTAELERTQTLQTQRQAQEHNAMIKERYRRLQDAEAEQFSNGTENNYAQQTPRASAYAPEAPTPVFTQAPATAQTPQITEFVHERIDSPVFTTEKFSAVQEAVAPTYAPAPVAPMQVNVYAPTQAAVETETQYTFSSFAKKMMIAFAATATVMLSVIGINTGIINRNAARLQQLESQEQALILENEELQRQIQAAENPETIMQFAEGKGMIKG